MTPWNQYRLIDIMSSIDMSFVEEELPEGDLDNLKLFPEEKGHSGKKRIALISGLAAAGSIALTGVILLAFRKHAQNAA